MIFTVPFRGFISGRSVTAHLALIFEVLTLFDCSPIGVGPLYRPTLIFTLLLGTVVDGPLQISCLFLRPGGCSAPTWPV